MSFNYGKPFTVAPRYIPQSWRQKQYDTTESINKIINALYSFPKQVNVLYLSPRN